MSIGYRTGKGHVTEPIKLACRLEAVRLSRGGLCLDLFSGAGQLATHYRAMFKRVVTVDKFVTSVDYTMSATEFILKHLDDHLAFDMVDFDDEGCPALEIQALFSQIKNRKREPFILALTDGMGLHLRLHSVFDPHWYLIDEGKRKASHFDFVHFERMVTGFVVRCAKANGFRADPLSSHMGRHGNVCYQTWLIETK